MNEKVLEKELLQIKNAVTMPENLAVELSETALEKGQKKLSPQLPLRPIPQSLRSCRSTALPLCHWNYLFCLQYLSGKTACRLYGHRSDPVRN